MLTEACEWARMLECTRASSNSIIEIGYTVVETVGILVPFDGIKSMFADCSIKDSRDCLSSCCTGYEQWTSQIQVQWRRRCHNQTQKFLGHFHRVTTMEILGLSFYSIPLMSQFVLRCRNDVIKKTRMNDIQLLE